VVRKGNYEMMAPGEDSSFETPFPYVEATRNPSTGEQRRDSAIIYRGKLEGMGDYDVLAFEKQFEGEETLFAHTSVPACGAFNEWHPSVAIIGEMSEEDTFEPIKWPLLWKEEAHSIFHELCKKRGEEAPEVEIGWKVVYHDDSELSERPIFPRLG